MVQLKEELKIMDNRVNNGTIKKYNMKISFSSISNFYEKIFIKKIKKISLSLKIIL